VVASLNIRDTPPGAEGEDLSELVCGVLKGRLQEAVRPSDLVCTLGGNCLAVCFADVDVASPPSLLGDRLARAVAPRLTLGSQSIDVYVIAHGPTAPESIEPIELTAILAPVSHDDPDLGVETAPASWSAPTASRPAAADMHVLVVDPTSAAPGTPGVATLALAALLSRLGLAAKCSTPVGAESALTEVEAASANVVLLVLHAGAAELEGVIDDAWERPAALTRAYRLAGAPVIAVNLGGSAAALAACVEQGAAAVADIDQLPAELERLTGQRTPPCGEAGRGQGSARVDAGSRVPPRFEALTRLTPTERRVLYHLTEGLSAVEISQQMIVSLYTIRAHVRSILRKLNVKSQIAAVAIANGMPPHDQARHAQRSRGPR
jgi:DNA-binding NarL/FixJ family response regulator